MRANARKLAIENKYGSAQPAPQRKRRADSPPPAPPRPSGPSFREPQAQLVGTLVRTAGGVKGLAGKMQQGGAEMVTGMGRKARTLTQHVADFARDRAAAQALAGIRIIPLEEGTGDKEGKKGKKPSGHEMMISQRVEVLNRKRQRAIEDGFRMGF